MVPTAGPKLIGPARQLLRDVRMVGQLQGRAAGSPDALDILAFPAAASGQLDRPAGRLLLRRIRPSRCGSACSTPSEVESMIAEGHCEFVGARPGPRAIG